MICTNELRLIHTHSVRWISHWKPCPSHRLTARKQFNEIQSMHHLNWSFAIGMERKDFSITNSRNQNSAVFEPRFRFTTVYGTVSVYLLWQPISLVPLAFFAGYYFALKTRTLSKTFRETVNLCAGQTGKASLQYIQHVLMINKTTVAIICQLKANAVATIPIKTRGTTWTLCSQ